MKKDYKMVLKIISVMFLMEGTAMIFPFAAAKYYGEAGSAKGLLISIVLCLSAGAVIFTAIRKFHIQLKPADSWRIAFICWITAALTGMLPYLLCGESYTLSESFFESAAGFTTTGAWTIEITEMPLSIIMWKSVCNWLGGMGLLVLTASIFPVLGIHGRKIAEAEIPGPVMSNMYTRFSDTAKVTYLIYISVTVLEFLLLLPGSMSPFEALVNTMSTISTAGTCDLETGMFLDASPYTKAVITIFSIAGSVNFIIYYLAFRRKWSDIRENAELRAYIFLIAAGTLLMAVTLKAAGTYSSFSGALGDAFVQTVSFSSTSGFKVADTNLWPSACKMVMIILVTIGACANSTGGSIKVIRAVIYFKLILRGVYKRIHPRAVKPVIVQKRPVSAENASTSTVFIFLFFAVFIAGAFLLAFENQDLETTLSASLAALTNNGTGFGAVAMGNFGIFSAFGKTVSALLMLAGRLELYAVMLFFSKPFWPEKQSV